MRCIFITLLMAYCAIATAGASEILVDLDPNKAPSLTSDEQCTDAIVNAATPIWPKNALVSGAVGWAIVRYDLDGSGRGQNVDIAASAPLQVFDKASLDSIKRSKFTTGFIKAGCKAVFVYSLKVNKQHVKWSWSYRLVGSNRLRFQLVAATHCTNRCEGV